jgi:hypothetical protein
VICAGAALMFIGGLTGIFGGRRHQQQMEESDLVLGSV